MRDYIERLKLSVIQLPIVSILYQRPIVFGFILFFIAPLVQVPNAIGGIFWENLDTVFHPNFYEHSEIIINMLIFPGVLMNLVAFEALRLKSSQKILLNFMAFASSLLWSSDYIVGGHYGENMEAPLAYLGLFFWLIVAVVLMEIKWLRPKKHGKAAEQ